MEKTGKTLKNLKKQRGIMVFDASKLKMMGKRITSSYWNLIFKTGDGNANQIP